MHVTFWGRLHCMKKSGRLPEIPKDVTAAGSTEKQKKPRNCAALEMVGPVGLEPTTKGL